MDSWRLSTHLFIAWTILLAGACAYDLAGPRKYDDAGALTNGTWAGRAVLVWVASAILLAVYRTATRSRS